MTKTEKLIKYQIFSWKGTDLLGNDARGYIPARTIDEAEDNLQAQHIEIETIKEASPFFTGKLRSKVKAHAIMIFFRQLATMIKSGIPLVQCLEITAAGIANVNMIELIMTLHHDVSAGNTFSSALKKHPRYFNYLIYNLVDVGEQSGTLDIILLEIAGSLEKSELIKGRVKKALFYPALVLLVTIVVAVILLLFIVPRFQSLFAAFGAKLPGPTQVVIDLSKFMQNYWWVLGLTLFSIVGIFYLSFHHFSEFRRVVAKASLHIFIFGELIRKSAIANITRTLSIALAAGLPLVSALECVSKVTGNIIYEEAVIQIRELVITGTQLHEAMSTTKLFPVMAVQMLMIGEKSGEMEVLLGKIADFYEEEVNSAVEGLSTLVEPLMLVLLGIVIGGFVISMYLPIFRLGTIL
ncbi:MAG: hypothetical protein A3F10_00910 [Coxiella sp. RIFCSPHIGHO2_12_FULL_42_15]|nr:MAG: hypothetical protein A3F10_00910 [Coxiella sp. RIFCSPHIGHO2_12_FULL_42_15]